jgi:hypothetical protein
MSNLLMPNKQKKYINIETSKENCIKQTQQSGTTKHAEKAKYIPDTVCTV